MYDSFLSAVRLLQGGSFVVSCEVTFCKQFTFSAPDSLKLHFYVIFFCSSVATPYQNELRDIEVPELDKACIGMNEKKQKGVDIEERIT